MITVYLDMDGVLTDLDGMLAERAGMTREEVKDPANWAEAYQLSLDDGEALHWARIPPNSPGFHTLIRWCHERSINVEILTSYGQATVRDCGAQAHKSKVEWLTRNYLSEFQNKRITRFNGVQSWTQKKFYATSRSLLVDDQARNVFQFRDAGGRAILYNRERHSEFLAEFLTVIGEMKSCVVS